MLFVSDIMLIVVEADIDWFDPLVQCTTVPFRPMLTESINNLDIKGCSLRAEILVKMNVEEFTTFCAI